MKQILNTLYIQTQGAYLRLDRETLKVEIEKELKLQVPLHHLGGIFAFGNVLFSPFLIHKCAEEGRNLVWLTEFGRFKARIAGSTTGNVLLRRTQNKAVDCPETGLSIARYSIAAKLQNTRSVVMRASREAKLKQESNLLDKTAQILAEGIQNTENATDLAQLRGIEGYAAKAYFGSFTQMVRQNRDAFAFTERTKKPPRDPINALLSFTGRPQL
ncbi:MAG: CRISPR-associated endonuclease Cas1 [Xenococcaceae cyanobacterium MO_188.B32]|nr:CRISPR-associated endonuclease Cas1 [Xenococcaceae cyanobacterium MO_188.B32]